MAFNPSKDFEEPVRKLMAALGKSCMTMEQACVTMMGTVPQSPPKKPRGVRCAYCGAITDGERCGNCGAPVGAEEER